MTGLDEAPPREPSRPTPFEAFAITYKRPAVLEATLRAVFAQTVPPVRVLVMDNDPAGSAGPVVTRLAEEGHPIEHHPLGDNLGPAGASAIALERLRARGVPWALWIDDDDPPRRPDDLERISALLPKSSSTDRIAVVGAIGQRWSWKTGVIVRVPDEELRPGPVEVDYVAGGCQPIVNVEAAAAVGYPDARLFFGLEELEFCLRLRRSGYRIRVDGALMHERRAASGRLGLSRRRAIASTPQSSPWRQYYSTRNYIFFTRKTFDRPDLAARWAVRALAKALYLGVRAPFDGAGAATAQLRAVRDAYLSRMGRTAPPREK